jgi:hypothetical protein
MPFADNASARPPTSPATTNPIDPAFMGSFHLPSRHMFGRHMPARSCATSGPMVPGARRPCWQSQVEAPMNDKFL